jgi:hypothetical protein
MARACASAAGPQSSLVPAVDKAISDCKQMKIFLAPMSERIPLAGFAQAAASPAQ